MTYNDTEVTPISSLRCPSKNLLSLLLNPIKLFASDEGLPRDWRGLASLTNISGEIIPAISNSPDPTTRVLSLWCTNNPDANLKDLQVILEKLDRFDVIDDTKQLFEDDARNFREISHKRELPVSTSDSNYLTIDDANLARQGSPLLQAYDAYVLYADEDIDFVTELIERMSAYGFKLCIKDRDLLGGLSSQHTAVLRLIAERCSRLLIILSPSFVQYPENAFFYQFAQALGIDQQQRKIVPVLYKKCVVPPELSYYFLLDYERTVKWNFWDKLRDSISTAPGIRKDAVTEISTDSGISMTNTELSQESAQLQLQLPNRKMKLVTPELPRVKISEIHTINSQKYLNGPVSVSQSSIILQTDNNNSSIVSSNSTSDLSMSSMSISSNRNDWNASPLLNFKKCRKHKQWFMNLLKPSSSVGNLNGDLIPPKSEIKKKNRWLKRKVPTVAT